MCTLEGDAVFGPKNLCWHLGNSKESTERPKHSVNGVELKTQSQVPNTRHEKVLERTPVLEPPKA